MTETRGTASTTRPTEATRTPTTTTTSRTGDEDYPPEGGRRKRRGRSIPGCLAALVALALIAGGAYVAVTKGAEFIRDQFSTAADYPGPGRGKVTFEVESGDTVGEIGRNLKAKGVVQSVDAFIEAVQRRVQHPGGLLPAEEGDAGGRRLRRSSATRPTSSRTP